MQREPRCCCRSEKPTCSEREHADDSSGEHQCQVWSSGCCGILSWGFDSCHDHHGFDGCHHPELRGKLCRVAYETVQEMMTAATIGSESFRTGMVAFAATAGDLSLSFSRTRRSLMRVLRASFPHYPLNHYPYFRILRGRCAVQKSLWDRDLQRGSKLLYPRQVPSPLTLRAQTVRFSPK